MIQPYYVKRKAAALILSFFRFLLIFGLCYLILKPFVIKILVSFMSPEDLTDVTVVMIPRNWSTFFWKHAWKALDVAHAGLLSMQTSVASGVIQVIICSLVGYGLGRFEFPGKKLALIFVIATMLVPPQVYRISQYMQFRYFNIFGFEINLIDTAGPMVILSLFGLGLKQGLYIYLMRSFFIGLPKDLESAAYIDGASVFRTFISVILPNARTIIATVFLFSFCWQWTDISFSSAFFSSANTLASRVTSPYMNVITSGSAVDAVGTALAQRTAVLIIILPLLLLFVLCQKSLTQSITTSGLAN